MTELFVIFTFVKIPILYYRSPVDGYIFAYIGDGDAKEIADIPKEMKGR